MMGTINCGECGITFSVPDRWHEARRDDGKTFWCPNGHGRAYNAGKSKADVLAEQLSRERQRLAEQQDALRREQALRQAAERQASAARGVVTRLKNRAAAGVCPCCNRTFANLARHMAGKHPSFRSDETTAHMICERVTH